MLRIALLSAAALAAPTLAAAQAPVSELLVTASRTPTAQTPYSATAIGPARLATADGVADALTDLGDVYIQAPGGRAGFGSLFLRGADPNFTAVLFEGVPLNNPTNTRGGAVNISELSAAGLDRVEVVAGPLSGLYGSGALAGAVNMVAAAGAADFGGRMSAGLGTRSDYSAALTLRGPLAAGYGAAVTLDALDDGEAAPASSFRARTLTGKLAPLEGDGARLVLRLLDTEADAFPDNSGGPLYATLRATDRREGREALAGVSAPLFSGDGWLLDASASVLDRRDETVSPGVAPSAFDPVGVPQGEDLTRYRRWIVQGVGRLDRGPWSAVAGLEAQDERARSRGRLVFFGFPAPTDFAGDRTTLSAFAEAARTGERWTLNGGLRFDDVEDIASRLTGRLGARYALSERLAVRASLGTGFKAPSFYALGNPFVGNPNLRPETSQAGEVALDWTGDRFTGSAAVFHSRYEDLIDFLPGPIPQLANRSRVTSEGVSARLGFRWTDTVSSAWQAQYAETADDASGQDLLNRPNWRLSSAWTWAPRSDLTFVLRQTYVGERDDYATPTGPRRLDAYRLFAVEAAWAFAPQTTIRLVVDNALDETYEAAIGFPGPSARARLMLSRGF